MHVRIQGSIWSGKPRHANLTDGKSRAPLYNGSAQIASPPQTKTTAAQSASVTTICPGQVSFVFHYFSSFQPHFIILILLLSISPLRRRSSQTIRGLRFTESQQGNEIYQSIPPQVDIWYMESLHSTQNHTVLQKDLK